MTFSEQLSPQIPAGLTAWGTEDLVDRVRAVIAGQAGVEASELHAGSTIESLGLDSLGVVETIFALEETFEISIPFNANEPGKDGFDLSSVGAIIAAVQRLVAGPAA